MITELQQDIKTYTIRELELTKELKNRFSNENVPAKFLQKIEDLTNINEKYLTEKTILQEKLMKAREEKEQLNQRIKLLESQVKRSKVPQDLNTREHTEKIATFLWEISASR